MTALEHSGADLVMVGRAALGRPWLPGAIARQIAGGAAESDPDLHEQFEIASTLYLAMVEHHGLEIGRRHARKHLAAAIDVAGECAGASADQVKAWRAKVLTAETPENTLQLLRCAFDSLLTLADGAPAQPGNTSMRTAA